MSDEQTPPELVDTSETGPTGTEGTDWQQRYQEVDKRYNDIRPEFDRKSQRLSEVEQALEGLGSDDPDTRVAAAQALGIEIAEEDEDFAEPLTEYDKRIAKLEATLAAQSQAEQQSQVEQRDVQVIVDGFPAIEGQLGRELTPKERKLLGDAAWANRDEQGLPNVAAVGEAFLEVLSSQPSRPKAPHFSSAGKAAEQNVRLDDPKLTRQERQDLMVERLMANES